MGVQKSFSQEVLCNLTKLSFSLTFNMFSVVLLSLVGMSSAQYFYRPTGYSHACFASPSHSYSWGVGNSFASVSRKYSPRVVAPAVPSFTRNAPAADVDVSAPSAKAAIAYIGETLGLDTCGEIAKGYIKTLENGGSAEEAVAAATSLYRVNFFARGSPSASAACKAAEGAYKAAFYSGRDPVTAAAEAYLSASAADSPCASAANEAALAAAKAFASATAADAKAGRSTVDAKCAKAAAAYAGASAIPSAAGNAALNAFVAKALETGNGFDLSCASAADKFIESYSAGESNARLAAAREYIALYSSNPNSAKDSPCAAAAQAFAKSTPQFGPTSKALEAFIDSAVLGGDAGVDPVCSAAASAYIESILGGATELAATEAASVAYISSLGDNPNFDSNSACGKAADAYIAAF